MMLRRVTKIIRNEEGATAVEYGLIIAMIILAMMAALSSVADGTINMWDRVAEKVTSA